MLDLNKLNSMAWAAAERISNDKYEPDKIYLHISDIIREAVRQHVKVNLEKRRLRRALENLADYVLQGEYKEEARRILEEISE